MSDEVAAPTAAPAAAPSPAESAPQAPSPQGEKPKSGTPELARWHAQRAQAVLAKESAEQASSPAEPQAAPERDPRTGKFLKQPKAKAAEVKTEPEAKSEPREPKPAKEEGQIPDSVARLRRLVADGKTEQALSAIGLSPEGLNGKNWGAWRAEAKRIRSEADGKLRDVEQREARLSQVHQDLMAEFKPLHDAKKALAAGDLDEAFKLFAGTDFNTFSRNYLRQSTSPNVGKDPAVLALQKRLEQMEQENRDYRQREQQASQQQAQERKQREYLDNMVRDLESSDDPRISRAANRPAFQRKVFQIQQEHYDPATDWTIPTLEAAQLAIDSLASEYGEWSDVFGGSSSRPEPRGESRTAPARAATPARPTARAVTTLSQKEAAEAATEPKLKGKALIAKYVAQANAAMYKANGIG